MPLTLLASTVTAIAIAGQAAALSCLRPDVQNAFAEANAAPETYVVVLGEFSGGPGPRAGGTTGGEERTYTARFSGHLMNRDGKARSIDREVTVREGCAASWCSELATGQQVLTFLQVDTGAAPLLALGPCYPDFFTSPTQAQLEVVKQCFVTGCTAM
jgi:hypothetical protein